MFKFKTGDEVQVTVGKDKGKKGKIEKVIPRENRVVVAGVNLYKRHKRLSATGRREVVEAARPLPVANVALLCPKCGKRTRVGFTLDAKTKKRICKKCGGVL